MNRLWCLPRIVLVSWDIDSFDDIMEYRQFCLQLFFSCRQQVCQAVFLHVSEKKPCMTHGGGFRPVCSPRTECCDREPLKLKKNYKNAFVSFATFLRRATCSRDIWELLTSLEIFSLSIFDYTLVFYSITIFLIAFRITIFPHWRLQSCLPKEYQKISLVWIVL